MTELQDLIEKLRSARPSDWDALPDIPLYMDQILSLMNRQTINFDGDDTLTGAMVNNYIKDGVMPRADGKRYSSEHLAYLTCICILKQVLPVRDIALMNAVATESGDMEKQYASFCTQLDRALERTADELPPEFEDDAEVSEMAIIEASLRFSLLAYSYDLACRRMLGIVRRRRGESDGDKRKAKREAKDAKKRIKETEKENG